MSSVTSTTVFKFAVRKFILWLKDKGYSGDRIIESLRRLYNSPEAILTEYMEEANPPIDHIEILEKDLPMVFAALITRNYYFQKGDVVKAAKAVADTLHNECKKRKFGKLPQDKVRYLIEGIEILEDILRELLG